MNYVWTHPLVKHVVVVDDDIDVHNPSEVEWAIATRVQADRDVTIIPRCQGVKKDVSQCPSKRLWTAKMGIDATIPIFDYQDEGETPPFRCDDGDVKRKVETSWKKYGIKTKT
jgi:3-polyprenyl-4-hydroxybenzoate decarboxylase